MSRAPVRRTFALFSSAALLALTPAAAGQKEIPPEAVLGKDDAAFARELSRNGFPDLAELVRSAMGRGGGGGSLEAAVLALDIEQDQAYREGDPMRRIELLEGLVKSREDFVRANGGTPEAASVIDGQIDLYRSIGEAITQIVQANAPETNVKELTDRGTKTFEKAEGALREALDALNAARKELRQQDPEGTDFARAEALEVERMLTRYNLARTIYFHSLLHPEGSFERGHFANKSQDLWLDFQLDYHDQLLCFEGFIYQGLSFKSIGDADSASESFDEAIKLRATYEEKRGVYDMEPAAKDIVSSAVLQKMLLLSGSGQHAEAAAVADDFFASSVEGWNALKGLAILSELAEIHKQLGDQKKLMETAKRLVELDPYGPGGQRGRELLGEGGGASLGASEVMKLAEASIGRDPDKAIQLFQQSAALAMGTAEQDDIGSRAGLMIGAVFAQRNAMFEATVAWDTAAERYPKGKDAPECLWRAINSYLALQAQDKRPLWKALAQERMNDLLKTYPDNSFASRAGLIEGAQAEAEGNYARAAEIYERIPKGSAAYEEALYKAGSAWSQEARKAFAERRASDGKAAAQKSETLLKSAREALNEAASKTLETSAQDRFRMLAYYARIALANLYLIDDLGRANEVAELFRGLDAELAADPVKASMAEDLRFRALEKQGKLSDAIGLLDAQLKRDPSAAWVVGAARKLAPGLDARGTELLAKDPRSVEGEAAWRKAAEYYRMAIIGQLEGREAVSIETLESVADRLFLFGLHAEGVPDKVESFVEWPKQLRGELIKLAARAYTAVLPLTASYRTVIKHARTQGFLGNWSEAATQYADLFARENFVSSKKINQSVLGSKPELLFAFVEWGQCERQLGIEQNDTARLARASDIFEALVGGTVKGSKLWWQSEYNLIQVMVDRGQYELADVSLDSLALNYQDYDGGEYGLKERFVELAASVEKRVFNQGKPGG
jgi:tetratricopeptide (TPR) repeat protein